MVDRCFFILMSTYIHLVLDLDSPGIHNSIQKSFTGEQLTSNQQVGGSSPPGIAMLVEGLLETKRHKET